MAGTVLTSAIPGIHDEGLPNINDGNEDWGSAGLRMMLAQAVDGGSYVRSDSELTFTNHDGANDTVDVTAGVAYLDLAGETVQIQSGQGGDSPPAYDTTLPTAPAIPVIVPNTATVAVQDSTLSSVWVAYATDGAVTNVSAGDVYLRSDDTGSVTAPPHPSVEIGQANPDDASADTLLNRFGSPTFDELESTAVNTDQGTVGSEPSPRPLVSNQHRSVSVPGDYSTIQAAIDACPRFLRHEYVINVDDGAYDEDLLIQGIHAQNTTDPNEPAGEGSGGDNGIFQIIGDTSTPSNVEVNSAVAIGCTGAATPQLWGLEMGNSVSPHINDGVVGFFGCQEGFADSIGFRDSGGAATYGVRVYGGRGIIRSSGFGTDILPTAVQAKRAATVNLKTLSGTTTNNPYEAIIGSRLIWRNDTSQVTGPSGETNASVNYGSQAISGASEGEFRHETRVKMPDDKPIYFGSSADVRVRWDSSTSRLVFQEYRSGSGVVTFADLDPATGDMRIEGTLTEGHTF